MMHSILYRIPDAGITELFETDDLNEAVLFLQGIAINSIANLIDFSPELDGVLDRVLDGVKLSEVVRS